MESLYNPELMIYFIVGAIVLYFCFAYLSIDLEFEKPIKTRMEEFEEKLKSPQHPLYKDIVEKFIKEKKKIPVTYQELELLRETDFETITGYQVRMFSQYLNIYVGTFIIIYELSYEFND